MPDRYEPGAFEAKWRARWQEADLFRTREDDAKPKFYALDFFPYPSGAGLSVGHCRNYIPTDVLARAKYMQGFCVLHPMGFDAFGLPAENEAIKRKSHPAPMIDRYAARYKDQMDLVGIGYDWSRSFKSCEPSYYKWTQWIFKLLYERGLAYRKTSTVNWDPIDKTVLADEEVIAGRAERSGALVEKKEIPQWYFKITAYAQRLIDDLDLIDWPEGIKAQQRNWIGRSEGVEFEMTLDLPRPSDDEFLVKEKPATFRVFTTRVDTVYGMTFCVLSPEHPALSQIMASADVDRIQAIRAYQEEAQTKSDAERTDDTKKKTGVFTGAYAIHPMHGGKVPVWIADYVLAGYGTGAIMAVPAHDERDWEFAETFGLEIIPVIKPADGAIPTECWSSKENAVLCNSGPYDGMSVTEAQAKLGEWMETREIGERKVIFKLRDWLISRQRYWGCPIPVMYTPEGEEQLVPDDALPVFLPNVESYEPSGDGSSPLAGIPEFVNVTDLDGRLGRRETDTMGGFACSSWYFLRFCDPFNEEKPWDFDKVAKWMPVDTYVGGAEHAVMHLLYARFWTKVLYDAGLVPVQEPFAKLRNQGQVLGNTAYRYPREDEKLAPGEEGILVSHEEAELLPDDQKFYRWARMSKSKGNVVTPEEAVETYGADALRIYELFVAPFEADVNWSNEGMNGAVRFLGRIFKFVDDVRPVYDSEWRSKIGGTENAIRRATHQAIAKATDDIERFAFNTYISALMVYVNKLNDAKAGADALSLSEAADSLICLIAPAAPHSADELWEALGHEGFTYHLPWPVSNPKLAAEDSVTIAIQVNGKLRDTLEMAAGASNEEMEAAARASEKIIANLEGKTIRKVIVIPGKLVNVVAN